MKVRLLRNLGTDSGLPQYKEGQVVTVNEEIGNKLCESMLAEAVKAEAKEPTLKAIPKTTPTLKADAAGTKGDLDGIRNPL